MAANAGITAHRKRVAVSLRISRASRTSAVPAPGRPRRARACPSDSNSARPPSTSRRSPGTLTQHNRAGAQVQPGIEGLPPDITELVLVIAPVHLHQPDIRFSPRREAAQGEASASCLLAKQKGWPFTFIAQGRAVSDRPCAGARSRRLQSQTGCRAGTSYSSATW